VSFLLRLALAGVAFLVALGLLAIWARETLEDWYQ
jgi:hypothetical protein